MGQRERRDLQLIHGERRVGLLPAHRVGLRPGQCHDGSAHSLDAPGAVDGQRLGAVQTAQRLQKPGQPQNVVAMVVGEQHRRKPIRTDAVPPQADLRALAAVEQNVMPAHRHRRRGQRPFRQWLRAAGAQQGNFQHRCTSFQHYPIIKRIIA